MMLHYGSGVGGTGGRCMLVEPTVVPASWLGRRVGLPRHLVGSSDVVPADLSQVGAAGGCCRTARCTPGRGVLVLGCHLHGSCGCVRR